MKVSIQDFAVQCDSTVIAGCILWWWNEVSIDNNIWWHQGLQSRSRSCHITRTLQFHVRSLATLTIQIYNVFALNQRKGFQASTLRNRIGLEDEGEVMWTAVESRSVRPIIPSYTLKRATRGIKKSMALESFDIHEARGSAVENLRDEHSRC